MEPRSIANSSITGEDVTVQDEAVKARDELLEVVQELQGLDKEAFLQQAIAETRPIAPTTWSDLIENINSRTYKTWDAFAGTIELMHSELVGVDKKKVKLSKGCANLARALKKSLATNEVKVRKALYSWHPRGREGAAEDAAKFRDEFDAQLKAQYLTEHQHTLVTNLQSGTQGMKHMSEAVVKSLENTQNVASTNDFGTDPFATQPEAELGLPVLHALPDCFNWIDSHDVAFNQPRRDPASTFLPSASCGDGTGIRGRSGACAGSRWVPSNRTKGWKALRRGVEWKARWLHLRIQDLAWQEATIQDELSALEAHEQAEAQAYSSIRGLSPLHQLPPTKIQCNPHPDFKGKGVADLMKHPFFRECAAAVHEQDVDHMVPASRGAVQADDEDAGFPASMHAAFQSLREQAQVLKQYLESSMGIKGNAAPKKGPLKPPRKGPGVSRPSTAHNTGRHLARQESAQKRRRVDTSTPMDMLCQSIATHDTKKEELYVPLFRKLTPADLESVTHDPDAEFSSEEDTSDAYYMNLHAKAQAAAEAAREKDTERKSIDTQVTANRRHGHSGAVRSPQAHSNNVARSFSLAPTPHTPTSAPPSHAVPASPRPSLPALRGPEAVVVLPASIPTAGHLSSARNSTETVLPPPIKTKIGSLAARNPAPEAKPDASATPHPVTPTAPDVGNDETVTQKPEPGSAGTSTPAAQVGAAVKAEATDGETGLDAEKTEAIESGTSASLSARVKGRVSRSPAGKGQAATCKASSPAKGKRRGPK